MIYRSTTDKKHNFDALASAYQRGDDDAIRTMIVDYKKYWRKTARDRCYRYPRIRLDDMISLIYVAAWKAAKKYDPQKGRFLTIMGYQILSEIKNWMDGYGERKRIYNDGQEPITFTDMEYRYRLEGRKAKRFDEIFVCQ